MLLEWFFKNWAILAAVKWVAQSHRATSSLKRTRMPGHLPLGKLLLSGLELLSFPESSTVITELSEHPKILVGTRSSSMLPHSLFVPLARGWGWVCSVPPQRPMLVVWLLFFNITWNLVSGGWTSMLGGLDIREVETCHLHLYVWAVPLIFCGED